MHSLYRQVTLSPVLLYGCNEPCWRLNLSGLKGRVLSSVSPWPASLLCKLKCRRSWLAVALSFARDEQLFGD